MNITPELMNIALAVPLAITASQAAIFAISTVSYVSTYRGGRALLDAGRPFSYKKERRGITEMYTPRQDPRAADQTHPPARSHIKGRRRATTKRPHAPLGSHEEGQKAAAQK